MDSNWFKIWPGKLRTVASSLPTGVHRAYLMQIAIVYLDEGGLPADPIKIAFKTSLPKEIIEEMSGFWEYLGRVEDGRLHLDFLDEILKERAEFAEKKAKAGSQGGKAKADTAEQMPAKSRKIKQNQAQPGTAKQNQALLNTAKQSLASTDRQTNRQDSVAIATGADAPPEDDPGETDAGYKAFKARIVPAFCAMLDSLSPESPPYVASKGDWVQLAALHKRCQGENTRGQPWVMTSDKLAQALGNYRESVLGKRTLADFAVNFSTYFQHPLDRFGRPLTKKAKGLNGASPPSPAEVPVECPICKAPQAFYFDPQNRNHGYCQKENTFFVTDTPGNWQPKDEEVQ